MPHPSEQDPAVVLCLFNGNVAQWSIMHTPETDDETITSIEFGDDAVRLYTDTDREIVIPEDVYNSYGEALQCATHMILEVDPFGNFGREYNITAPVVTSAPMFRG
jgi:hypothetical protein|nr:hypothetical protein [Neorhizobium tomejilense]